MSKHRMIKLVQLRTLANEAESTIRCKIRPEIRNPKLKLTRSIKHAKQSRQQAEQSGQWVSQPSQAVCESSESGQPAKQDFVAQIMRYRCCQTGKGFNFKTFHDKPIYVRTLANVAESAKRNQMQDQIRNQKPND